jgi:hypothetical protein
MSTADLAYGRPVLWHGYTAEIIDIDWQRLNAIRVRIRIPRAQPRTRWVLVTELEPL